MYRYILCSFLFVTLVQAQLNGEFWWLNSKLTNLKKVKPVPPKVDFSDFQKQKEESSKIVFRDDDLFTNKLKPIRDRTSKLMPNNNSADNKVIWPTEDHMKSHDVNIEVYTTPKVKEQEEVTKPIKIQNKNEDVLVFSYPKNDKLVTIATSKASTELTPTPTQSTVTSETLSVNVNAYTSKFSTLSATKDGESQNICSYTTKKKCYELNGFVYEYARRVPVTSNDEPLICCILPIQPILNKNNLSHTIHFPQTSSLNRYKRSETETSIALQQRDFLLKHKFTRQGQNIKPASTPFTKIVTPPEDDYVDPYWNIKNTKSKTPTQLENTKYNEYNEESHEYADELPKPGLIGLYSDHAQSPSSWPFPNGNKGFGYGGSYDDYEDEDDEEESFGYSTIDPRKGTKKRKHQIKPQKVATTSDDLAYDAERHTINFQSDPDFHVFQGFKLLNLFRNTSRVHTKKTSNQDTDVLVSAPDDSEETVEDFDKGQLFGGCGKVVTKVERGSQVGEAANGSHPWLALVVLTKSRHNVLCYATLIHPRAAITIADCTQGTAPGDVTVITGLWDLNDRSRSKNRVATVHVHPRYKPGEVENNLAILYWMRPLKLSSNIQPACLGHPEIGDECKLFGWGGLDQGIQQPRPRWQRATVRTCSARFSANKRSRLPADAVCVPTSRPAVTGVGGPLICEEAGHSSIVGVVVSRDSGYVLSPVRNWAMKMGNLVSGD